ncbi:MAG TPA: DNA-3-methyladenine glycosylase [Candidatus Udaeobacter sp.]|nr:DNA-3-methyladenine glycosylase [Candidatus Udaeobacter sp.]
MSSKKAIIHLKSVDPVLGKLFDKLPLRKLHPHTNYFQSLTEAIIGQQLSVKAADTIIGRFRSLFKSEEFPSPKQILAKSDRHLRSAGMSWSKASYVKNLAKATQERVVNFKDLEKLKDEEIIEMLVKVKGVGRWTAEMFLIFSLGRPDIFSPGDLGLRNAIKKLYGLRQDPSPKKLHKISSRWQPYRTYASLYLWASLDNTNRQKS